MQRIARRQLLRHKTDLDEWPHPVGQQPVIDLVHIRKVVERISLRVFVVEPDLIIKNCVEAHVFESRDGLHLAQVAAVILAQRQDSAPRAKHLLPEMRERMRRSRAIDDDHLGVLRTVAGLGRKPKGHRREKKNNEKQKKQKSCGLSHEDEPRACERIALRIHDRNRYHLPDAP